MCIMFGKWNKKMRTMTRLLYTEGKGSFQERTDYDIPNIADNEIRVKSVFTGICRSDIAMMNGKFGPLPLEMQGHEGLGQVLEIGKDLVGKQQLEIGAYVATRGEPAFADEYNVKAEQFVRVPEADPKYIIEPVACGVNCVLRVRHEVARLLEVTIDNPEPKPRAVIVGSGFLAKIIVQTWLIRHPQIPIDIIGSSNKQWYKDKFDYTLLDDFTNDSGQDTYDIVFDLKEDDRVFNENCVNNNGVIVMASEKPNGIDTTLANLLWKSVTMLFPSPRSSEFFKAMALSKAWIEAGEISVDGFWTRGYDRDSEWEKAFSDANDRQSGYNRGYIKW